MPSAFKSRNEVSVKENGLPEVKGADFGYDENVFARLKVAQDSLIEDLECKIVVSSVVGQAVLSGIVKALSEESSRVAAAKDAEISSLQKAVSEKIDEGSAQLKKVAGEYFDKIKATELCVLEKERELCKMAESLVDLTFRLQGESLNNLALEKKMREVEAKDEAKQKKINALTEEMAGLRRERSSEAESLKREIRIKEIRLSEQLEESESQLSALREENSEQLATISALAANQAVVNDDVCQLVEAHKESMEAIERLRVSLEEQQLQHGQELDVVMEVYEGQVRDMQQGGADMQRRYEVEADILACYFESQMQCMPQRQRPEEQEDGEDEEDLKTPVSDRRKSEADTRYSPHSIFSGAGNGGTSVIENFIDREVGELETDIIIDCFTGFAEDVRTALELTDLEAGQFCSLFTQVQSGRKNSGDSRRNASYWKTRSLHVQQRLVEQHYQHQLEMDVLMEFFVSKLGELQDCVMKRAEYELAGDVQFVDLQRENATLRREKDQVLIDKTEEMFRLKRDFFKELDKQKLEGDEFGILKKQFADSRQKLDRILDKKQRSADDNSDSETTSQSFDSVQTEYGKFSEEFPTLVSDLQNEIEQLLLDTGMADDSCGDKAFGELQDELDVLSLKYEDLLKVLEIEKQRNFDLTADLQELEHNVNLSNGELERLLRQLETEKQARLQKEGELQTIKHDVTLLRRQMETVLSQLEIERSQKKRMQSDSEHLQKQLELSKQRLESLQKELHDVLRVKVSISEELNKLRCETFALGSAFQRAVERQTLALSDVFANLKASIEEKDLRMRKVNDRLSKYARLNKRKQGSFLVNLQKAEEEVDLLGDENDYLVNLLEKVFLALEHYSSVLQHYPGIANLSKLIKAELVSRIEHPAVSFS